MYNEHRCLSGKMHSRFGAGEGRFGRHFGGPFGHHKHAMFNQGFRKVPVNIEETESSFIIELFAPALVKENLKVITKDDVLTISYQAKEEADSAKKYSRREYSNGTFERAFGLNGKVLVENISASYADGILKVTLPKNPETNTPEKDILVD
ncbi:Acid shock protein [Pedobacter sp. Bi27]|uniref:Hsp20/alpha crystallin family protein n=1 Tax=unclassified Pedobacter TaxID=2628915 RepID=UPI001D6F1CA4|nr:MULTISPECIES: Hsp20/alpha crystallin family protein [unclassified Pedobacter]CAH0179805.1 Acid shock protein [Pedobacter sp. Bi36]CAH0204219.1 Acid shock protein [Pedobacter sp. Bi27]CAH0235821.1 Acid shock protein [Pedobacter sp. Bi126]